MLAQTEETFWITDHFADWESVLQQVFDLAKQKKVVLAIDEFPYLLESDPEFSSILQMIWDQHAGTSKLMLILSGSHYHMMFKEFISGKGPLYGRSTADLLLEEIEPYYEELVHYGAIAA